MKHDRFATRSSLSTVYQPKSVEERIYRFWEESGLFKPRASSNPETFSVVMPPPNVTGSLHLGHAWNNTLQDIIVRQKRMSGVNTVWIPGSDHAGIATQTRVEKALLQEEGKSRHELGRTEFVRRVWDWKNKYGNIITSQVRALGSSCDWSRERFTMDEGLSRAVREVFVQLYDKGLIYRGNRIINWCPRCETALSDIEVEHIDVEGNLYDVAYPLVDGSGELTVATTRPETMFADVAVAVHPDDERYQSLVGKLLRLPLTDRQIPIIADEYVDMEYGTGCVKITPAHDPNDFEVGRRHQLEMPQCIQADGRLNEMAGPFQGLTREEGRKAVVGALQSGGYLRKSESMSHAVGHCSRCDTVVEPYLSDQWFVSMTPLAESAISAVQAKELRFVPERFERVFLHWMENVRDWCISRQLWWGHRIPAWYCDDCGAITVSRDDTDECGSCHSRNVRQEEDVLDTWFSSALWPFSTMGWPEKTADYETYYPTGALVTAYDILFFWVDKMLYTGKEFTGRAPFQNVVVHGLIRDSEGRKMSKSLGNGVDPLEVIEKYGADALRFTLATGTSPGNDQRFSWEKVESSRNFINKIWNASRFVLMNLDDDEELLVPDRNSLGLAEQWIMHRLALTVQEVSRHLERYDFGEAGRALYDFAWDDFCDWYIELSKLSLYGEDETKKAQSKRVLVYVLDNLLRLLHPFIPFVTEEIWSSLGVAGEALIVAEWPRFVSEDVNDSVARQMNIVMETIRAVRNIRAERNVPPTKPVTMVIKASDDGVKRLLQLADAYLVRFCNLSGLAIDTEPAVPEQAITAVVPGAQVFLPLADLVDLNEEIERLEKEKRRLEDEVNRVQKKLQNTQFVSKAPAAVVEAERAKEAQYQAQLKAVEERLGSLKK